MISQIGKSLLLIIAIFLFGFAAPCFAVDKPPAGIGLVIISDRPLHYVVQYIVPSLPAAQTDIKIGDEVLAVDDVAAEKIHNLDELVARIRGDKGTTVKLKVATSGVARELTLTRGEIPEIKAQSLPAINFGREAVTYFYQREDILPDSGEAGLLGNHNVRSFLRSRLRTPEF